MIWVDLDITGVKFMFKEFPDDDNKNDDFLNEFRQKISDQNIDNLDERNEELKRSKNIFLGIAGGITLACIVGWFILAPQYRVESEKDIPVIRRPQTAIRIQPNEPGGMDIPNQDKTVYNIIEKKDDNGIENLLPPPEAPKLPVIAAQDETSSVSESPVIPEAEKIIQKAENTGMTTQEIIQQAETQTVATPKEEIKIVEKVKVAEVKPVEIAKPEPQPTPKVENKPIVKAETKPAVDSAPKKVAPAVVGNWQIQLMSSPNKPAVEKAKIDLGKKYKISHLPFEIEAAVLDQNKTFYRLKVGAYKTRAEADKLCNDIKALGGTCIVKKK